MSGVNGIAKAGALIAAFTLGGVAFGVLGCASLRDTEVAGELDSHIIFGEDLEPLAPLLPLEYGKVYNMVDGRVAVIGYDGKLVITEKE